MNELKAVPETPENAQRVCIDLPGEQVRCIVHKPKLQVMLRKHRDVIFEIEILPGAVFTVEADRSDFYNARDKKLMEFEKKQKVRFKSGERLHLWVSRNFRGNLILKAGSTVLGRYSPNQLDRLQYTDDPAEKAAPLLIRMDGKARNPGFIKDKVTRSNEPYSGVPLKVIGSLLVCERAARPYSWTLADAPFLVPTTDGMRIGKQYPTTAVVDVDSSSIPEEIMSHLAQGGGKTGLADIDHNEIVTRNWLYGQLAGAAAYAGDNWSWLRNSINRQTDGSFRLVKARIHYVRGKARVYFSGFSRGNPIFGPGGHGLDNAKVVQTYSGMGGASSAAKAMLKSAAGTVKGNALVSLIFGSAATYAEWKADALKDGYDLMASLLMVILKTLIVAALTAIIVAVIAAVWMLVVGAALAVIAVAAITIVAGVLIGYGVDLADKKLGKMWKDDAGGDGLASGIADVMREAEGWLSDQWGYLEDAFSMNYVYSRRPL